MFKLNKSLLLCLLVVLSVTSVSSVSAEPARRVEYVRVERAQERAPRVATRRSSIRQVGRPSHRIEEPYRRVYQRRRRRAHIEPVLKTAAVGLVLGVVAGTYIVYETFRGL